jgi:autophagy-related protein 2
MMCHTSVFSSSEFQIRIVAVHVRPDPKLIVQECCLKVTLLPLRLNIDQDSLLFLYNFFTDISGLNKIKGVL